MENNVQTILALALGAIALVVVISLVLVGVRMGQDTGEQVADKIADAAVSYDFSEIDNTEISGAGLFSLIMRGIPVFRENPVRTGNSDNRLTLQEAKEYYSDIGWYHVEIVELWNDAEGVLAVKPYKVGEAP